MSTTKPQFGRRDVVAAGIVGGLALPLRAVPAQGQDRGVALARFVVLYDRPSDEAAFQRHYREVHVPLVKQQTGLRRYHLSRNLRALRGGDPYYMIAELEYDDMAALQRVFQSPEGLAARNDLQDHLLPLVPGIRSMIYEVEEIVSPPA